MKALDYYFTPQYSNAETFEEAFELLSKKIVEELNQEEPYVSAS